MKLEVDQHHLLNLDKYQDDVVTVEYQNPHATGKLKLSAKLAANPPDEQLQNNVRINAIKYPKWLQVKESHRRPAVILGGGASIGDHIDEIKELQKSGAAIFALNGASIWAQKQSIERDYQVVIDSIPRDWVVDVKGETEGLIDKEAKAHLFASRCSPDTLNQAPSLTMFHLRMENPEIEELLPSDRVKKGGYVVVGGGATIGITALCVAFSQGYREFHVFGYDSSHRDGKEHAYSQPGLDGEGGYHPDKLLTVQHAGREFITTFQMSKQPSSFMEYTKLLKADGCTFQVYGDGLLQAVYNNNAMGACVSI